MTAAPGASAGEFRGTERFAILRPLGAGGMGAVYEALDRERDERIALKTLRRIDGGLLYRLKTEFRALQNLHHPNLIRFGELIEHSGQWFFTMELLDGDDFLDWVRRPLFDARTEAVQTAVDVPRVRRAVEEAATLDMPMVILPTAATPEVGDEGACDYARLRKGLVGVARGLAALHDGGLVHRDVKPSNIVVTRDDRVVLLDFGLVRGEGFGGERSSSGSGSDELQVVGTPAYMAPEQAVSSWVEPAGDWYAVGVMIYQALCGSLPFTGSPMQMLWAKQRGLPPPPSSLTSEALPADLETLCMALLEPDPAARPSGREIMARLGDTSTPSTPARRGTAMADLVGREELLAELEASLEAVADGRPVACYVSGRSGLGKTTLVERFLAPLRRRKDAVVLQGRCYERETVPYKALDSLIDDLALYLQGLPAADVEALLPYHVGALAQVFPVLGQVSAVALAPPHRGRDPVRLRARALGAFKELIGGLAKRKALILYIDDLQWGDADSAALLADLLGPPRPPGLLLVGAYRSDNEAGPIVRALAPRPNLAGTGLEVRAIHVEPMTVPQARALAVRLLGELPDAAKLADAIAAESGGSPFFIGEMVRYLQAAAGQGAPLEAPSLDAVLEVRVGQLSEPARRLLEIVAMVGRPLAQGLALRALGSDEGSDAIAELRAAHLVRTHGSRDKDRVEAYHDRIREAVVGAIPPARGEELRAALATALIESQWLDPDMLGVEFLAAVDRERARAAAVAAAEHAAGTLAFDRAATLYQLAIGLSDDVAEQRRLRRARADALTYAARGVEAAADYLEVARTAPVEDRLDLQRLAADNLLRSGHVEEGLTQLDAVLGQLGARVPRSRRGAILSLIGKRIRIGLRGLGFVPRAEADVPPRDLARIDALYAAASTLGMIDNMRGAAAQSQHLLRALALGEERRVCRALIMEVTFLAVQGRRSAQRADELARSVVLQAERTGDAYLMGSAQIGVGTATFFTGRYRAALDAYREAERALSTEVVGAWWERNTARYFLALAQINTGDLVGLAATVEETVAEAERRRDVYTRNLFATHPSVWCAMRDDQLDGVEERVKASLDGWPADTYYQAHHLAMVATVMLRLYQGDAAGARSMIVAAQPMLRTLMLTRLPFVMAEIHKLLGQAAVALGDTRGAVSAAKALRKVGFTVGRAFAANTEAAMATAAGDADRAQMLLVQAVDDFEHVGSAHDAAACRFRLGELVGGGRGERLSADALAWMHGQGIASPERMIAFLAPRWGGTRVLSA